MAIDGKISLPVVGPGDERERTYEHPLYKQLLSVPGLSLGVTSLDALLTWGLRNSLWVFPMATSCCGIELMAAAASRVDLDRMGTIVRATPRQADVMVVAGTITVKMAPRVKKLWDQMPEPKWAIAMGSCAISGDFYRDLYPVVPGIDTFLPVDVYIPGCPPNPEALMHGLLRLQEKVRLQRLGQFATPEPRPALLASTKPSIPRLNDPEREAETNEQQTADAMKTADSAVERPEATGSSAASEALSPAPALEGTTPPASWRTGCTASASGRNGRRRRWPTTAWSSPGRSWRGWRWCGGRAGRSSWGFSGSSVRVRGSNNTRSGFSRPV